MRNRKWVLLSSLGLLAVLIGEGIYTDFSAGKENSKGTAVVQRSVSASSPPEATYNNTGPNSAYSPDLADGDGKEEVAYNCGLCHGLSYITMRPPLSAQDWSHEVNMMRGFYGASMSDSTAQKIVKYLGAHYTPETIRR